MLFLGLFLRLFLGLFFGLLAGNMAEAGDTLILQSTTSTQNSGLYEYLLPQAEAATGIRAYVVAVGSGQALRNAERCDGDLLITHSPLDEAAFVAAGFGLYRKNIMYNDYVVVGPKHDPAAIAGLGQIESVLRQILTAGVPFISRGDDSGTHKTEQYLWQQAEIDPSRYPLYRETGSGMGPSLTITVEMGGYSLTDRSTWIFFANKQDHAILFEGDPRLFNQYGIIPIHHQHCPHNNSRDAARLAEWLLSPQGQAIIAGYRQNGKQLFFPNATHD